MTTGPGRRFRSPCRRLATGPRVHHCSPAHADVVEGYRTWRSHEEQAAEAVTLGYATETDEYWSTHQRPTFGRYLTGMAQKEH